MTRVRDPRRIGPVLLVLTMLWAGSAWGLTDEEIFREFQFNFINPGARALGLGGAFIAAGDDATAAESNPAALHYVDRYEAFIEYRSTSHGLEVFRPTQEFGDDSVDSTEDSADFVTVTDAADSSLVSFASFAYPFKVGRSRGTVAFSRQVVLDVQNVIPAPADELASCNSAVANQTCLAFSSADYPIVVDPSTEPPSVRRYGVRNQVAGSLDAQIVNYNLGFSISLTQDFSLGVTGTLAQLDVQSSLNNVTSDPLGVLTSIHPRVDVGGVLPVIQTHTAIDGSDSDFAYTVGLHWHPDRAFPNRGYYSPIRFGFVYRKGAELSVDETIAELDPETGEPYPETLDTFLNVLKVPDRFGVGFSYEIGRHWLVALDLERIQYSDLLKGFRPGVNFFTNPGLFPNVSFDPNTDLVFDVDDATVAHAGVEYSFASRGRWVHGIRVGYFNAPDNRIRLTAADTGDDTVDTILLDLFRAGEDVNHYTVGFSLDTPVGFQIQVAGNFADGGDNEYVASAIWRFGKIRR